MVTNIHKLDLWQIGGLFRFASCFRRACASVAWAAMQFVLEQKNGLRYVRFQLPKDWRGKFLKKLWCGVGGKYNKIIWFYQLGW